MDECGTAGGGNAVWSVARTHANREPFALEGLERQGFRTFCPMAWQTFRHGRRLLERKSALFPGYVFVVPGPRPEKWRSINGTRGVRNLLTRVDGRPGWLPAGFVESLRAHTSDDGVFTFRPELSAGEQVRVSAGSFADFVGRIESLDARGRAWVLLEVMSREVRVSIRTGQLERAA